MKTNELRIGNWIHGFTTIDGERRFDIPMMVHQIDLDSICADFVGNEGDVWEYAENEIEGIEITQDLVIDWGFNMVDCVRSGFCVPQYGLDVHKYRFFYYDKRIMVQYLGMTFATVEYVHQFQNIYFALTSQELIIEL